MTRQGSQVELPVAVLQDGTTIRDVADMVDERYDALLRRYEWLEAMLNHVPDYIYAKDTAGRFLYANRAVVENNGFSHVEELIGLTDAQIHPHAHATADGIDIIERRVMQTGEADLGVEERRMKGEGWLMMSRVPLRDRQGQVIGLVGASRDITARKRAEELMSMQARLLRDVATGVAVSAFIETAKTTLKQALGGLDIGITLDPQPSPGETGQTLFPIVGRQGEPLGNISVDGSLLSEAGLREFLSGVAQAIGIAVVRDRDIRYIAYLAEHDALTGLANRSLFDRSLAALLAGEPMPLAVAFIDVDNFKLVNDSLGHAAGDDLLKVIASRILSVTGADALVSRIGGDEFIVVLQAAPEDAHLALQRIGEAVSQPMILEGREIGITCSIGVAFAGQHGTSAGELLARADIALFDVKKNGRNGVRAFSEDMAEATRSKIERVAELRRAIEQDEFILHFQPQKNIVTGAIVGAEALVRWQHPREGLLPPASFISLAEEVGLISAIGECVLRKACREARRWQDTGLPGVRVAVNVSARQFREPSLCQTVAAILDDVGLDAALLELEITESMIMEDVASAIARMEEITALGVSLAIDDFGTGYSSLSTLKMFPITRLKIDRSFIADIPADMGDVAIVKAIVTLSRTLGLEAVAEGIETPEQLALLSDAGCDAFQGYYLAKPMAASEFSAFVRLHIEKTGNEAEAEASTGNMPA
ncbi:MAG: EAL domain-containing protein [Neorhizobium sp.]|nr:EAL domain-containing protein [Neorhizobium sp.]